jgi:hypothetical protein
MVLENIGLHVVTALKKVAVSHLIERVSTLRIVWELRPSHARVGP